MMIPYLNQSITQQGLHSQPKEEVSSSQQHFKTVCIKIAH